MRKSDSLPILNLAEMGPWTVACKNCGATRTDDYPSIAQWWEDPARTRQQAEAWLHDGKPCEPVVTA